MKKNSQLNFDENTDLILNGIVDSLGMVELIQKIESDYNIRINGTDLKLENFVTISRITELIDKYLGIR